VTHLWIVGIIVAMWVKRTPAEVVEVRRYRRRHRIRTAIWLCVFVSILTIFMFGWRAAGDRGRFLVPAGEIPARLPVSMVFGVIIGVIYFAFERRKPTVVCPKCGVTQYAGDSERCSCGGRFEDIEEMKWV